MDISLRWINRLLTPGDVSPNELEQVLTAAGFPIESREDLASGDTRFDVEITSNRGDCLSHVGLAREIAASRQSDRPRRLSIPAPREHASQGSVRDHLRLENHAPGLCARFTARVIRGVRIGPSPAWLVDLLESVGQRSINNVVDVTNWLTFQFGQPSHVFDLDRLTGSALIVRHARAGETLRTLDGIERRLIPADLVVADGERAQSLAGVIGGEATQVSERTTNVVLEVACWDPVIVRTMARRLNIRTDASHRFERGVDGRTIDEPAAHAASLIVELAGGTLAGGMLDEGAPRGEALRLSLRPSRVRRVLGVDVPREECAALLRGLAIDAEPTEDDDIIACTVPAFRLDLTREIDLIEEVARTKGYDAIPLREFLPVRVPRPQESERALREIAGVLAGLGFFETVTFSFTSPQRVPAFLPPGLLEVRVDDERRGGEPSLRPSPLVGLLACRRANQDAHASVPGGVRLFERASAFAQDDQQRTRERTMLSLLMDVPGEGARRSLEDRQHAWRILRGTLDALVRAVAGPDAALRVEPGAPTRPCWSPSAFARLRIETETAHSSIELGEMGLIAGEVQQMYDLAVPVLAADLDAIALASLYPPRSRAHALPAFPAIERDLSIVVGENTPWSEILAVVQHESIDLLEHVAFVGTYRGKQVGQGRKSVTFRMRFRARDRTLRHEQVDPQVAHVVASLASRLGAEVRGGA